MKKKLPWWRRGRPIGMLTFQCDAPGCNRTYWAYNGHPPRLCPPHRKARIKASLRLIGMDREPVQEDLF